MKPAKPSLIDRALKRLGLQKAAPTPLARSAFAGAQSNRLTLDWVLTPIASADAEQKADLVALRARGREIVRNTSVGAHYMQVLEQNVIGPGIRLQAKNQTKEGDLHDRANTAIEDAFAAWSEVGMCTMDGALSFTETLGLAIRTMATDGEWLCEMAEGEEAGNAFGFALNMLDADLLDVTLARAATPTQNEIRQGVEINKYGRPVAYWLLEKHRSDTNAEGKLVPRRIDAARIIHLFIRRRPRQTRGTTWFAPVMMDLRMFAGYVEAELVAARVASAKMGSIELNPEYGDATLSTTPGDNTTMMDADPGTFMRLNPGETLKAYDPQHPTTAFGAFSIAIKQHIAAGLGTSYGTLTGDLSQANYGSQRVGMLNERDFWKYLAKLVIEHVCKRVYRRWLPNALINGQLAALNSFDASRWQRVQWQSRGFPWIDPAKDIDADATALALGIEDRTTLCAEQGRDYEEILERRQQEKKLEAQYGVAVQEPTLGIKPPAPADPAETTDENAPAAKPQPARGVALMRTGT